MLAGSHPVRRGNHTAAPVLREPKSANCGISGPETDENGVVERDLEQSRPKPLIASSHHDLTRRSET
jgi:hypothetical protein